MDARGPTYTTGYTTSSPTLLICPLAAQAKNEATADNSSFHPRLPPPAVIVLRLTVRIEFKKT
jgi:hypothetical protein